MEPRSTRLFRLGDLPTSDAPLTVCHIIGIYLRHSAAQRVHGAEALEERRRTLAKFCDAAGTLPVAECRPFHLTDFIEAHATWRSPATRRSKANAIRAVFQWAADQERIGRNPFKGVRYADAERRPELSDDVLDVVARLANKPFGRAIRFLRLTGCRVSELCRAVWTDVDMERGVWTIQLHKSRRLTGRPRVVALVAEAVDLLRSLLAPEPGCKRFSLVACPITASPGRPIFTNNRGAPWNRRTLGQQFRRMKRRHGIQAAGSLHGIRHRWATHAVANGAPLKLVAAQLGHSTVAVTERYYVDLSGEIEAIRAAARLALPRNES